MDKKKNRSENRQRNNRVTVRLSDDEYKILSEKAALTSLTNSTFLREAAMKKRIKTTIDSQILVKISELRAELRDIKKALVESQNIDSSLISLLIEKMALIDSAVEKI